MSSTNKTANYELSQYIGSDKPTYLGDYNSDMLKIDTQMKANADEIVVAKTSAQTANTTAGTALSTAQTANQNAQSAGTTASTANTTANSALAKANANEADIVPLKTANTYSTSEIVVGTWIDGKPLYRRVFTGITPNATSGIIGNIPDIEQAVKILGLYNMAGYWTNFEGGISTLNVLVQIQVSTGDLYYSAPSDCRNKAYILTVEYTKKTTD